MLTSGIPLEDELGDVLDKALRQSGLTESAASERSGVALGKIRDAIDYRCELDSGELSRLASTLNLNEVGLVALSQGRYPMPEIGALPFCVWPLRIPHGIGVVNAYVVGNCGGDSGLLFDVGPDLGSLTHAWPRTVRTVDAIFLTHFEAEHAGELMQVMERFGGPPAFVPAEALAPCGQPFREGEIRTFGSFEVTAFSTPGHAAAHNCYFVRSLDARGGSPLLISGDLIFAGSAGGAYFCRVQLRRHLRRMLEALPPDTVIAPGHGPLTTVANELRFNPFMG